MIVTVENIQNFLQDIKGEYEKDSNWDVHNISLYLMDLAGKVAKYINYWTKMKHLLIQVDNEYNKLYYLKYSDYKDGNINYTQTEIKDLLPKDPELVEITYVRSLIITVLDSIEKMIDNFKSIRFDIKNYIEMEQFLAGK